jgi:hypothetical protein
MAKIYDLKSGKLLADFDYGERPVKTKSPMPKQLTSREALLDEERVLAELAKQPPWAKRLRERYQAVYLLKAQLEATGSDFDPNKRKFNKPAH